MSDEEDDREHRGRIGRVFSSLDESLQGKQDLDDRAKKTLVELRTAAESRDADAMRTHLTTARDEHGWLYREMASHPELASLVNELALWGF